MYQAIFFDVDGTLLSVGEGIFEKEYMMRLVGFFEERFPSKGKAIAKAVNASSEAMVHNDGSQSNAEAFWKRFEQLTNLKRKDLEPLFTQFYNNEFSTIGDAWQANPIMVETVTLLQKKGYPLVIATNPMLPDIANKHRLRWCGVGHIPWLEITDYEHYRYGKHHPGFYQEICDRLHYTPSRCLMIGNGMIEDMAATQTGLELYLLLDEVKDGNPDDYHGLKGYREDLLQFVKALPHWKK